MSPPHLLATIYRHLGIDPGAMLVNILGRPMHFVSEGQAMQGVDLIS